jgi:hypothetical protein
MWNLVVFAQVVGEPKPIASNHRAAIYNYVSANPHSFANGNMRIKHGVSADMNKRSDGNMSTQFDSIVNLNSVINHYEGAYSHIFANADVAPYDGGRVNISVGSGLAYFA